MMEVTQEDCCNADWHYIDAFRIVREQASKDRSHRAMAQAVAAFVASEVTTALAAKDEELAAAKTREAKLRACLGFFASVIKSGEPWTATCEQRYRAALSEQQP